MNEKIILSLVIPAYNEEKRIGKSLEKIIEYLYSKDVTTEVLVINDGSKDNTSSISASYKEKYPLLNVLENEQNKGKGYSVKRGVLSAAGDFIIFTDADLSTPIEETDKVLSALQEGYDVAIGSRHVKGAKIEIKQPLHRHIMGRVFNFFVRIFTVPYISDSQCGFKGFKKEKAIEIFNRMDTYGWSFDVEILYLAHKLELKIKEVPITWRDSPASRINPLTDPLKMFTDVIKIRWKHRNVSSNNR